MLAFAQALSLAGGTLGSRAPLLEICDPVRFKVVAEHPLLRGASVVRQEKDERVFQLPVLPQRADEATDVLIHRVDLGRVDGAAERQFLAVFFGDLFPGCVPGRGKLRVFRDDSHLAHRGEFLFAKDIPPGVVAAFILVDDRVGSFERPVRGVVGEIEKKRRFVTIGFLQKLERKVGVDIGRVEFAVGPVRVFRDGLPVALDLQFAVEPNVAFGEDLEIAVDMKVGPVEPVEPALLGQDALVLVTDMPFSTHQGSVARFAENLCQRGTAVVQAADVAGALVAVNHVPDARLVGIEAGQQAGPRGAAPRRVVEIGVTQTTLREGIEVRGLDLTAEAAEVRIPHIVRQDQNDVGSSALAEFRCSRGLCFRARIRVLRISVNADPQ